MPADEARRLGGDVLAAERLRAQERLLTTSDAVSHLFSPCVKPGKGGIEGTLRRQGLGGRDRREAPLRHLQYYLIGHPLWKSFFRFSNFSRHAAPHPRPVVISGGLTRTCYLTPRITRPPAPRIVYEMIRVAGRVHALVMRAHPVTNQLF